MEINPNRSVDAAAAAAGSSKARSAAAKLDTEEETSFSGSASLDSRLKAAPESRAEVVARAEALVASSSYPPPEVIKRIANLLASNLVAND